MNTQNRCISLASRLLCFLFLLTASGYSQTFPTQARRPVRLGSDLGSFQTLIADFNHDQKTDLLVSEFSTGKVRVLLGDGAGGFAESAFSAAIPHADALAVGDFDGDGNLDIAVTSPEENRVTILLGDGLGGFTQPFWGEIGVNGKPGSIVSRDFNGDGRPDLAIAGSEDGSVTILLWNSTFSRFEPAPGSPFVAGTRVSSLAAGDFDGDGVLDLAVALPQEGRVAIWSGHGDGRFTPAASGPVVLAGSQFLAAGDFNRDGKLDLAVLGGGLHLLLGTGGGAFRVTEAIPTGGISPVAMAAGDFDGDGKTDLAIVDAAMAGLTVLLGDGAGAFSAPIPHSLDAPGHWLAAGDLDGDGRPDLAVSHAGGVTVLLAGRPHPLTAASSTTLAAAPSPSTLGQAVTLTASVNAAATGKVTFYDGTTVLGVAVLASGHAVMTTSLLQSGVRSLYAYYPGDSTYSPSTSPAISQTVTAVSSLGFKPSTAYPMGSNPHSAVVGDWNGDGKPDFAVANFGSNNVSVAIGNGDGTFKSAVDYGVGPSPICAASGDFNSDGNQDLVVANFYGNSVSILLGNGDGTFQPAVAYNVGSNPSSVAVADFNGDGKADLVVTNYTGNNLSVLLGNGDGTFQAAVTYATGAEPNSVAVGDFNHDGKPDLAVANYNSNTVSVLLGNGDGTFQGSVNYAAGSGSWSVVVADFNGDGKADLAVANEFSGTVTILLGRGDGTFLSFGSYGAGSYPEFLVSGDFNGDGKPDLAVGSNNSALNLLFGNGDGSFQAPFIYASIPANSEATADFNGDGRTDLLVTNANANIFLGGAAPDLAISMTHQGSFAKGQAGAVYTIIVSNAGSASTSGAVTLTDTLPAGLTPAAIGGAGWTCTITPLSCTRSDALAVNGNYPAVVVTVNVASNAAGSVTNTATVSGGGELNTGNDTASDPTVILPPASVTLTASPNPSVYGQSVTLTARVTSGATGKVAFYDGTTFLGVAALVSGGASLATVLLPSGSTSLYAYYSGDLNYAGNSSAAVAQTVTAGVSLGFLPPVNYTAGTNPAYIAEADLNGDGKLDLVLGNIGADSATVLLGNGDGTFQAGVNYAVPNRITSLVIGDFNGDGKPDLAVVNGNTLSLFPGNGDGSFQAAVNVSLTTAPTFTAAADFNRDGKLDLVLIDGSNTVILLRGNGDGTFQPPVSFAPGLSPDFVGVGDFNGDGKPDLVLTSITTGGAILLGNGNGTFQAPLAFAAGTYLTFAAAADFNGDGKLDLAVINYYNSSVSILLGNGDGTFGALVNYPTAYSPRILAIGDFNGDGIPDVAVVNNSYPGTVSLLIGNGDGTFQTAVNIPTSSYPAALVVGDFNGDGKADLGIVNSNANSFTIVPGGAVPDLTIAVTHPASLVRGQTGATYTITVSNAGTAASSGAVGVVDTLPAGITATAIGGNGWTCILATLTCTRTDSLAVNSNYPAIVLTVTIAANASLNVTNTATVSGGGETNLANDIANDPTAIRLVAGVTLTSSPNAATLGQQVLLTATVGGGATGRVIFLDSGNVVGGAQLINGQASISTRLLPVGVRSLRAQYSGDSTYGPGISTPVAQTVSALAANALRPALNYNTGLNPISMAVGDFNGDGNADLAIVNNGNSVSVLLGNGDGSFQPAVAYAVQGANFVTAADLNGDGKLDLVVMSNTINNNLNLLFGNGDGTFRAAVSSSVGAGYNVSIAVADFDRDGKLDLAVVYSSSLAILLGNGDGTFQAATTYAAGFSPNSVAIGDFNGDGKTDLAISNANTTTVGILLGNGDGSFQPVVTYQAVSSPVYIATGDFNGDGRVDLIVQSSIFGAAVLLGNGDGTFQAPLTTSIIGYSSVLAVADLNGDGKLDIAFGSFYSSAVEVQLGRGDGTFQLPVSFPVAANPETVAALDLNGDGRTDLIVPNSGSGNVSVLMGAVIPGLSVSMTHTGPFVPGQNGITYRVSVSNQGFTPSSGIITVTDVLPQGFSPVSMAGSGWSCTVNPFACSRTDALVTGGFYPDIIVTANVGNISAGAVANTVFVSSSTGVNSAVDPTTILFATSVSLVASPGSAVLGQAVTLTATVPQGGAGRVLFYDNSALLGVASLSGTQASLTTRLLTAGGHSLRATYSGDANHAPSTASPVSLTVSAAPASGFISPANFRTGAGPWSLAVGDFNGDGKTDLAVADADASTISILLGNGDGTFQTKVDYAAGTKPVFVTAADFNGDGITDLAVVNQTSNTLSVFLGKGDGSFQAPATYATGSGPTSVAAGDLNGDGKVDLAVANGSDNTVELLLGNGDGTFQTPVLLSQFFSSASSILIGDLNGDGKADLLVGTGGGPYLVMGNGDGTFQQSRAIGGYPSVSVAITDLNGDGKADVVATGNYYGSPGAVLVFLGNGDGTFQNVVTYNVGTSPSAVIVADLNGDGKLDVVAVNSGNNNMSIFLGNGDGTLQSPVTYATGAEPRSLVAADFNGDGRTDLAVANHQSSTVSVFLGTLTPILAIAKSHSGAFVQGQVGAIYTISVRNDGPGTPAGLVTVTDVLPGGLTATAISGTGWACTLATLTCTRSDGLAVAASYAPITVTVNVAANAPAQVTNQATVSGGGSPTASASDVTTIVAPPQAVSVTPSAGSGYSQAFNLVFSDPAGATDLTSAQVIFNTGVAGASSCYVWVDPAHRNVYLTNDAYSAWPGAALGQAGVLQNSQCIVNTATSGVVLSGDTLTVTLAMTFQSGYAGAKNVYGYASTAGGFNTGWQRLGTWNVPMPNQPPQAVSVNPASGSGVSQTFSLVFSDPYGAADLTAAQLIVNPLVAGVSSCYVWVDPVHNGVYLTNDAYNAWPGTTLGSGGTLQNSQCSVNAAASSVSLSGSTLTVNIALTFQAGYSGAKNVFGYGTTAEGLNSGWQKLGTWTIPAGGPQAVSVNPASASGSTQTFSVVFSDPYGASDLTSAQVIINPSVSGVSSCYLWVDPSHNAVYLTNDAYNAWPGTTLGSAGTLQNSQCSINAAASSVSLSGGNLTLNLALSFQSGYAGAKNVYGYATNAGGLNTGWQKLGTFTVTTGPQTSSVTPAAGSGSGQMFTLVFTDPKGAADLTSAQVIINTGVIGVSSCYVWVDPVHNGVYLTNDAYTTWPGTALGSSTTLANSQCTVHAAASSVALSGNTLTVNLSLTFQPSYAGPKNIYGYATTAGGLNTGWQKLGTWTPN